MTCPFRRIIGIGERKYEWIDSEKRTKDDKKITQTITRITEKTFILECGHEMSIHDGQKLTQKKAQCFECE
jgi:hypothetical protein